jgi:peptide/nickel transport system substrate-binding protein
MKTRVMGPAAPVLRGVRGSAVSRAAAAAALIAVLGVALTACGSSTKRVALSGSKAPAGIQTPATEPQACVKRGGTLNVLTHEDFEHIDPGQAYFSGDYQVVYATQRPLYDYKPNTFKEVTPDMAESAPEISSDAKTITIHIRRGVHFSPPVDREVTSEDAAYALERGANPRVANPYFEAYFKSVEGADKANGGPIAGIQTPDRYTLAIHLTEPKAAIVTSALVLPLSAPVPAEYAKKYDGRTPSEYGSYQVATGPYMFKANSEHKVLGTGYQPGESATLVRNPNWNSSTDYRPACLDEIRMSIGGDPNVIGRQVLEGSHKVQNDAPAQSVIELAYTHFHKQLSVSPGAGQGYVTVNNAHGPFRNVNLRKAFWAALDRAAMVKVRGGELAGNVMTHFIYPEIPGFEVAGGLAGPKFDFNEHPEGDMAVAEKYMKLAGYPSGRYTGSETLQIIGDNGASETLQSQIVNQTLKNLGFKTRLLLFNGATMSSKYCGVVKEEIDVCPSIGWLADFGDPYAVLYLPFSGKAINYKGPNSNQGQVNSAKINKAMEAAETIVDQQARATAWAKIDKELVEEAVAVPYIWNKGVELESNDVAGVGDVWNGGSWDYSWTSLK